MRGNEIKSKQKKWNNKYLGQKLIKYITEKQ